MNSQPPAITKTYDSGKDEYRYLSTETIGGFTVVMLGVFAQAQDKDCKGFADVDWKSDTRQKNRQLMNKKRKALLIWEEPFPYLGLFSFYFLKDDIHKGCHISNINHAIVIHIASYLHHTDSDSYSKI